VEGRTRSVALERKPARVRIGIVRVCFAALVLLRCGACRSVTTEMPVNLDTAVAAHAEPVRAWEVRDGGRAAGTLVRYDDSDHPSRGFFSVRNLDQQVLGIVDVDGRAWRYRPHVSDPEWLGTATVARAASWILGCGESCELVEIPLESLQSAREVAPR
jgi:hypothetical protein